MSTREEVVEVHRELRATEEKAAQLRRRRNALLREHVAEGASVIDTAKALGVTRFGVYKMMQADER